MLALLVCSSVALANEQKNEQEQTLVEDAIDEALADTPYINSLLIKREFPVVGGRWGWEMFIDAPLNGEPEGSKITLRRAKAKYVRNFGNNWRLKFTGNYSRGGGLELSDNFFSYSGWKRALVTFGISDPAFSLESITSSSALTFMERGLPVDALAERKSAGVTFLRRSPSSILQASLILANVSQDDLREEGQGIVLHYVHSPIQVGRNSNRSIHLGGSFSYRINASEESIQFRSRPEVATINDYYVDTGTIAGAEQVARLSLEVSQVVDRFSWQAEVLTSRVYRADANTLDFWGAYAYASWFLTGDSRHYHFGSGSFEPVKVSSPLLQGGPGAFEVAFRASVVDLTNRGTIGGEEKNLSIGLNWYINQRVRLMTNLVKVLDVDRPGSEYDGQNPLIFSLRAQWVLN